MSQGDDLYQELILDHQRSPRNFGDLAGANRHAEGHNPLCGDALTLGLIVSGNGVISDLKFKGSGCAISRASASLMTQALKGRTVEEARALFESFHELVAGKTPPGPAVDALGKLKVFAGVRDYPARVKCATLAWHTLKAALDEGAPKDVTTEEGG
jgi:nitrogen fixation protein NifU and related proteins